ncbi:MAG: phosphoribosylglycinamide formyltransferase [Ahrensia sp.]
MKQTKRRVAVFISGRGSNMEALLRAAQAPDYPAEILLVLADKLSAQGLASAQANGIETIALERRDYADKRDHENAIQQALDAHQIEIICLAGFMRLLSGEFLAPWAGRIINIHPSLLPKHKGLDTHQKALDAGDTEHGCTVHHVTAGMDEGPAIAQARIAIHAGDTAESLATRLLAEEHRLYPQALKQLIDGLQPS